MQIIPIFAYCDNIGNMKATISMSRNSLWKMIQAMSLNADNKLWLGEKLIEEARKEVAETAPCQYSVEELEHRLGESVQSYRKGDSCTSDELHKRHPVCE